jgi:hypothetical protein
MASVDFNREVFTKNPEQSPRQALRGVGFLILVLFLGLLAFLGYKVISESHLRGGDSEAQDLDQIQQQLAAIEMRMQQLEKRHKTATAELVPAHPKNEATSASSAPPPARPSYRISSASVLQPQGNSGSVSSPTAKPAPARSANAPSTDNGAANHEAWEATTNRLADVVQAVGEQEGELSQTRDVVNQLLAQTRRTALSFELRRGADRMPVGPVSLLLKSVDPRTQRYTVCVYLESKCIELKDRAVNEVVVFVLSKNSAPLELIATKVTHSEIVGYLEIPDSKPR